MEEGFILSKVVRKLSKIVSKSCLKIVNFSSLIFAYFTRIQYII